MAKVTASRLGRKLVRSLFGGTLAPQGRGFYITLELIALVWGTDQMGGGILDPEANELVYFRRSHDFARRLMSSIDLLGSSDESLLGDEVGALGADERTLRTIQAVLQGLSFADPFSREANWYARHFFPYSGQLIHYDSPDRKKNGEFVPHLERYKYRGAGILVYQMLRSDPDSRRLARIQRGFTEIIAEGEDTLGALMSALSAHDWAPPNKDEERKRGPEPLAENTLYSDESFHTHSVELLRAGTAAILSREQFTRAERVHHLMIWIPYCVARYQLERAADEVGVALGPAAVDLGPGGTLRAEARRCFDRNRRLILEAMTSSAKSAAENAAGDRAAAFRNLLSAENSGSWRTNPAVFFSSTLATVGALNANAGLRHYTMKLGFVESVVAATVDPAAEITFEDFTHDILFGQLQLVVSRKAATESGFTDRVNHSVFQLNEEYLSETLSALGLMTTYSDATRIVGSRP